MRGTWTRSYFRHGMFQQWQQVLQLRACPTRKGSGPDKLRERFAQSL
jgi:hypothetical protein